MNLAGAMKTNKAAYSEGLETFKKKCRKKDGYSVLKKRKTLKLVLVKNFNENIWGQMKSDPLIYNGNQATGPP